MKRERKCCERGLRQDCKRGKSIIYPLTLCCGGDASLAEEISKRIGYTEQDIAAAPEGANLGLGCGNPVALASLLEGEVVFDLGAGAGFDCFLAAQRVGESGRVIGVDMTSEMIAKARENARKGSYHNVEFRLGEIEHLPVADNSVDITISNCVINLVPDKKGGLFGSIQSAQTRRQAHDLGYRVVTGASGRHKEFGCGVCRLHFRGAHER